MYGSHKNVFNYAKRAFEYICQKPKKLKLSVALFLGLTVLGLRFFVFGGETRLAPSKLYLTNAPLPA